VWLVGVLLKQLLRQLAMWLGFAVQSSIPEGSVHGLRWGFEKVGVCVSELTASSICSTLIETLPT
jgi:hypothetical protein